MQYERLTDEDLTVTLNMPQYGDTTKFFRYAQRLWELENQIKKGKYEKLPCIVNTTSPNYKVIVYRGNDGTLHKTHSLEEKEAENRLKELQNKS